MYYGFNDLTEAEIEAKLKADEIEHKKQLLKKIIIGTLLFLVIFRGPVTYHIKFSHATPSETVSQGVTTEANPLQLNYREKERLSRTFEYQSLINKNKITLIPQARYEISGLIVARNNQFAFTNNFFDSAALFDIGLAWGAIGKKEVYDKYFKCYSAKTEITGSRVLWTDSKTKTTPFTGDYVSEHFSHSHLVPANKNIMAALLKCKKWQNIKIEGELVDMNFNNPKKGVQTYKTSLTRKFIGGTGDRGNGDCETIYVTKVQLGNKIYE